MNVVSEPIEDVPGSTNAVSDRRDDVPRTRSVVSRHEIDVPRCFDDVPESPIEVPDVRDSISLLRDVILNSRILFLGRGADRNEHRDVVPPKTKRYP
jgi:hypothetical protein